MKLQAATGSGSGNDGTGSMPQLKPGASVQLNVSATYDDGSMGSVPGATSTQTNPGVASVTQGPQVMTVGPHASTTTFTITALAPGMTTITVTALNGVSATIPVTVTTITTGGLTNPNAQPGVHSSTAGTIGAANSPAPQPPRAPNGTGSGGVQPQTTGGAPTASPRPQPPRH